MRNIFVSLLFIISTQSFAQVHANRHDKLTKDELQELKKNKDKFIPIDLSDTVVIVRYTGERLLEMQNKARNISFARNGTDTTGLTNQSWLTEKQMSKSKTFAEEDAVEYPQKLKKQLKKKGIKSIIVDESKLTQHPAYLNKYWLKTTYISSQKSLKDNGWILTITNMFYDPRAKKDFEVYLPLNSSLFELID